MFAWKVISSLILMATWVAAETFLAQRVAWWNETMVTSTVFWFVGSGFVLFLRAPDASVKEHFVWRNARAAFGVSVVLGFIMNFSVFSLWIELVLQPSLFILVSLSVVADHKDETRIVKRLVDAILGVVVVGLAIHEVLAIVNVVGTRGLPALVRQLALPIWMVLGLLPFLYIVGLYSEYEQAFFKTEWSTGRKLGRRLALMAVFGTRSHKLRAFIGRSSWQLSETSTFAETRRAIRMAEYNDDDDDDDNDDVDVDVDVDEDEDEDEDKHEVGEDDDNEA
jgi:uncharacterized membrane protein